MNRYDCPQCVFCKTYKNESAQPKHSFMPYDQWRSHNFLREAFWQFLDCYIPGTRQQQLFQTYDFSIIKEINRHFAKTNTHGHVTTRYRC